MPWRFLWALLLVLSIKRSYAATDSLIQHARELELARSEEWQRLLFYAPDIFGKRRGIIDDEKFYLSPKGKTDPDAELTATLEALLSRTKTFPHDEHPLCRYPARKSWLQERLGMAQSDWPKHSCPRFESWWKERVYTGLSIVFSSYFPNNPPSLFGHTFLRLHRPRTNFHRSELLDDIVSFSAHTGPLTNPITYALKGVFGGYPGQFSLMPYYMKIQEYNNIESRDLWEYELNADQAQIQRLLLSLWEFAPHYSQYFYFDDNCSYILLLLLETADPSWDFSSSLKIWVTPTASLKSVINQEQKIKATRFRSSALSRYKERYDVLSPKEARILAKLLERKSSQIVTSADLTLEEKRQVLDAALEWIDFKEKLGGSQTPLRFAELRNELLASRRTVPGAVLLKGKAPKYEDPRLAQHESWIMIGAGKWQQEQRLLLGWQPLLHDFLADDTGYAEGMEIQVMPMKVDYRPQRKALNLQSISVLRLTSLQASNRLLEPRSWTLDLGWQRQGLCVEDQTACPDTHIRGGAGHIFDITRGLALNPSFRFQAGALLSARFGHLAVETGTYGMLGPEFLIWADWHRLVRAQFSAHVGRRWFQGRNQDVLFSEGGLSWLLSSATNLRALYSLKQEISHRQSPHIEEFILGAFFFF